MASLVLECQDATRLMPDGCPEAQSRLSELKAVQDAINVESAEAGAKHRLYSLLEARTKQALFIHIPEDSVQLRWESRKDYRARPVGRDCKNQVFWHQGVCG